MSTDSDVLAVVVTYNSAPYIASCLDGLIRQGDRVAIAVVDNRSTDTTQGILTRFAAEGRINFLRSQTNVGFARACNAALERYHDAGQHVLLVNPDCILPDGAVAALLSLTSEASAGIATLRLERSDGTVDLACARREPDFAGAVTHALRSLVGREQTGRYHARPAAAGEIVELEATVGALMLMTATCYARIGGLDETFWMYGEDLDWCKRARDAGFRIYQAGSPAALHVKGGSSGLSRSLRVNKAFHQAMWLYYRKHLAPQHGTITHVFVATGVGLRLIVTSLMGLAQRHIMRRG